jgi:hypothetical protein
MKELVALFGTLGFECGCLLFPTNAELYDPNCNINCGSGGTQEWPPKNKRHLTTDIHFEYCHTPFRERGNKASIRVPKMFKSHI